MRFKYSAFRRAILNCACLTLVTSAAHAQENQADSSSDNSPPQADNLPTLETITVTGSRIERENYSVAAPLISISREDLEVVGSNDLSDAILEVPSIVGGLSRTNSTTNIQNAGLSSVDLRNLDDNRTLVLIDGRRAVSNSANGNRVSLGTIPSAFVDRVEVITGGASAIYGSDAVAGVVNIITKRRQEGWSVDLRAGSGRSGSLDDQALGLSYGGDYANGKGTFLAAINYDTESGLDVADVPSARLQASWDYVDGVNVFETAAGDQPASETAQSEYSDLSADPEGGRFEGGDFWFDGSDLRTDFVTNRDGFDFRIDDQFLIPRDRINLALSTDYEFDSGIKGFATVIYSDIETDSLREPEGDDFDNLHTLFDPATGISSFITAGRIPIDNPFVPEQVRAQAGSEGISWDRRFSEVGLQRTRNQRETARLSFGLEGDVFDEWNWQASVGYGRYEQEQRRSNEINILNLREGLNAEIGFDGQIQCASEQARAAGCVPVNLFGRGSISPEAADFIRADLSLESTIEQLNISAFIRGDIGSVATVFGLEYRDDKLALKPGALNQFGGHTSDFVPAFTGSTDVVEVFFEASLALLSEQSEFGSLDLDLSARHAEYSQDNVGGVTSFGAGLQWKPTNSINFRGSFNRALRAPDLAELFSPPRGDSDAFDDICDGVTVSSQGRVDDNCRADPGVLAFILENGEFEDENTVKASPNSGNLSLEEETAETFTIGAVLQPELVEGLNLAVDYYNIKIEDAISSFSNDDILTQCYDSDSFGPDNPFCQEVTRDSQGQISQLIQREFNLQSLETSGVDVTIDYDIELQRVPGTFEVSYVHSFIDEYESTSIGGDGQEVVTDLKGDLAEGNIENRSRLRLRWSNDDWSASWTTRFFDSVNDNNDLIEDFADALEDDPAAEEPLFLNLDREFFHDLFVSYTYQTNDNSRYRIYGGLRNAFANQGPLLPAGTEGDANEGGIYNVARGRYYFLGLNASF